MGDKMWRVTVTLPARVPGSFQLFEAVADAAYAWEPADRDGWDIDVSGGPVATYEPVTIGIGSPAGDLFIEETGESVTDETDLYVRREQ